MTEIIWDDLIDDGSRPVPTPEPKYKFGPVINWHGGDCPVEPSQVVMMFFRGRPPYIGKAIWPHMPDRAKASIWQHAPAPGRTDSAYDVIAYRVAV